MTARIDLARLDSLTKYPSIPTFHVLGERGGLVDEVRTPFPASADIVITEKVDGTNARIIILGRDVEVENKDGVILSPNWLIGSRKEMLTASSDLVRVDSLGIIDGLVPTVTENLVGLVDYVRDANPLGVTAIFGEVFGGSIGPAKQYTNARDLAFRVFDVMQVPDVTPYVDKDPTSFSLWRDKGGQPFLDERGLHSMAESIGAQVTPRLNGCCMPSSQISSTYDWLLAFKDSQVNLGGGRGQSEGVVIRTKDRSTIAKLRFEDYQKTFRNDRKLENPHARNSR